jgi:hypothetical protein
MVISPLVSGEFPPDDLPPDDLPPDVCYPDPVGRRPGMPNTWAAGEGGALILLTAVSS